MKRGFAPSARLTISTSLIEALKNDLSLNGLPPGARTFGRNRQ
jgi:hypothetical protein